MLSNQGVCRSNTILQ